VKVDTDRERVHHAVTEAPCSPGSMGGQKRQKEAGATARGEGDDSTERKRRRADRHRGEEAAAAEAEGGGSDGSDGDVGQSAQQGVDDAPSEYSRGDGGYGSDGGLALDVDAVASSDEEADGQPVAKQTGRQPKRKEPEAKPPKVSQHRHHHAKP
jgi:hypothetical protein